MIPRMKLMHISSTEPNLLSTTHTADWLPSISQHPRCASRTVSRSQLRVLVAYVRTLNVLLSCGADSYCDESRNCPGWITYSMTPSHVTCALIPRLHDTIGCQTGCTTGWTTDWMFVYTMQPVVQPAIQLNNRYDNRLYRVYKHLTGCQTGLTTSLTTGCIM